MNYWDEPLPYQMRENEPATTINLVAGTASSGNTVYETVRVERISSENYRILNSPGLVLGIAKGDVIEASRQNGSFRVVSRSGQICVQIYLQEPIPSISSLKVAIETELRGSLDGFTEKQLVLSVPVEASFERIESFLNTLVKQLGEAEWYYGNVYDPDDGKTPLNWWNEQLS